MRTSQTPENNLANDQEQDPNTALESVAKRYNSRRSFTRDQGQKEECGADTRQMLARRPRGATGSAVSDSFFSIASRRKPRINAKHPHADTKTSPISGPSSRMRRI